MATASAVRDHGRIDVASENLEPAQMPDEEWKAEALQTAAPVPASFSELEVARRVVGL